MGGSTNGARLRWRASAKEEEGWGKADLANKTVQHRREKMKKKKKVAGVRGRRGTDRKDESRDRCREGNEVSPPILQWQAKMEEAEQGVLCAKDEMEVCEEEVEHVR